MWKQLIIGIILALVFYKQSQLMILLGYFRRTMNHTPGPCIKVANIKDGAEDMEVLPNGFVIMSSGLQLLEEGNLNYRPDLGRFNLFDFNQPEAGVQRLSLEAANEYKLQNPHGISVWKDPQTDVTYLYAVNHLPRHQEVVDKFILSVKTKSLKHVRRIENDTNFHNLNELVVVGDDQFYFTNYAYASVSLEMIFNIHWASVGFYDRNRSSLIEKNLLFANGINVSPDGRYLYLALLGAMELRIYQRNTNNSLQLRQSQKLWTMVDNIFVDKNTGDLWIASHPVGIKLLRYIEKPSRHSPSQVLHIRLKDGRIDSVTEVYSDDGSQFSGSSIAVIHQNKMLIGSIYSEGLFCALHYV